MANKNNEVDLVVRAKNEASKTLDIITKAFEEFKAEMAGTNAATAKTNSAIGTLGNSLGTLLREAKGLSALGTIASNMDTAAGAVKRLESSVRDGAGEFAKLAREAENAERNVNRLRARIESEEAANKAAVAARKDANRELSIANKALKDAERNQERYNTAVDKAARATRGVGANSGAPQTNARASAGAFLAADLEQARASQARAASTVKSYTDEVTRSAQALKELSPQLKAASDLERRLTTDTQKQSTALRQNREALTSARTEQAKIKSVADQASAAMGNYAVTQENVARAAAKTAAELARTRAQIETLNNAQAAPVATNRRGLLESRRTFVEAQADVKRLAEEMRRAQVPTEAMGVALGRAQGQAKLAADAYDRNSIALRKTAATQSSLSQFLNRTATTQQQAANVQVKALAQVQRAATQGAAANRQLASATQSTLPPIRQLAQSAQQTGAATQGAANGANSLRNAFSGIYGESRKSLSLFQRIRGEVLALTASYLGLQAAIGQIQGVISAFQTIEAAQSRLGVVFNQDTSRVANELDFLDRNAQRLGISFEILSNQYSKFAVAANAANFTSQATRDIFLSVAEAGRVNKLSVDQLNGVFLALEQMISKGKVSSEELRRQLGDRLAGAFTIFADAIGVSTAELDEMLRKGEVISDQTNLLKFANELNKRFGPQLAAALKTTTTELGRFQNNIFQAQLRVGEGGFIEAFTEGLRRINEYFQSREGRDFFLSIGAALAKVTQGLVAFMPYIDDLARVLGIIAALKIARFFGDMVVSLRSSIATTASANAGLFTWQATVQAANAKWNAFAASLRVGTGAMARLNAQLRVATVVAGTAGTGFLAIRMAVSALTTVAGVAAGAFRLLWAAIGGLPGLILTGVSIALGSWLTGVEDTNTAIDEHKRIMGEVIASYEAVKGKTKEWGKEVKNVTLDQAVANLRNMQTNLQKVRQTFLNIDRADFFSANALQRSDPQQFKLATQIRDIRTAYENGKKSAKEFVAEVEALYKQVNDDGLRKWGEELLTAGRNLRDAETAVGAAAVAAKGLGDSSEETAKVVKETGVTIENLTEVVDEAGKSLEEVAKEKAAKFNEAMEEMGKLIPAVADELKRLEDIKGLEAQYDQAIKLATSFDDLVRAHDRFQQGMNAINDASSSKLLSGGLTDRIIGIESGGNSSAKNPNSSATGLGQFIESTWLKLFKKHFPDQAASLSDAMILELRKNADISKRMVEIYATENMAMLRTAGVAINDASVYLAHFLGPQGAINVIKAKAGTQTSDVLSPGQISANRSILGGRTTDQVIEWAKQKVGISTSELAVQKELAEQEFKRSEATRKRLEDGQFEVDQQKLVNAGKEREAAIEKAVREARAENSQITTEQIAKVRQLAAEEYDLKNVKTEQKTEIKSANQALREAQALEQQRNALLQQYKQAVATGDFAAQETLKTQITSLNDEIVQAATNARAMWEAIGGPEAAAKLPVLDALIVKAKTAGNQIGIVGRQTNSLGLTANQTQQLVGSFADGLVGVFDNFAQAVANGENAFQALGTAFLQFAAQFLREIATMILKQMILNALAGFGGPIGQAAGALGGVAVAHGGGVVGSTVRSRAVSPAIFAGAMRYHTGGVAGLKSNEVPAILERGETIRTEAQEEALQERMNAGTGGNGGSLAIRNVVTLDNESARNWLTSSTGEQAIWSVLGKDRAKLRSLTGK